MEKAKMKKRSAHTHANAHSAGLDGMKARKKHTTRKARRTEQEEEIASEEKKIISLHFLRSAYF